MPGCATVAAVAAATGYGEKLGGNNTRPDLNNVDCVRKFRFRQYAR